MAKKQATTPEADTVTPVLIKQARYDERHLDVFHQCRASGCDAKDDRLVFCGGYQFTLCEQHRTAATLRKLMPSLAPMADEPEAEPAPVVEAPAAEGPAEAAASS